MRVYTQLTQEQRYQIYALMKAEHNQAEIAAIVGVDKSTISREVRRNRGLRGYRPQARTWRHDSLGPGLRQWGESRVLALSWMSCAVGLSAPNRE